MPAKLDRCVEKLMDEGKSKESAFAICQASFKDAMFDVVFKDALVFDPETKTVVSVRDGIQEYRGHELGLEPADKVFRIYRAPETIKAIVDSMAGLPITDDHVSLDEPATNIIGAVVNGEVIDHIDEATKATVKIKNKVVLDSTPDNKQLSLGYKAELIDCDLYDFEQVDIAPHHLAVVNKGRCGETCKFTDKEKSMAINKAFLDADNQVNMQQVLQLVNDLPEAIKTMPIKDLAKLVPQLQKAVAFATETVVEGATEEDTRTPEEIEVDRVADEEAKKLADEKQEAEDAEAATKSEAEKKENDKKFSDSVADAVKAEGKIFADAVVKAKDFLPDTYDFTDKKSCDIMRDALATQSKDTFTDAELPVAFKMLKKSGNYTKFADTKTAGTLAEIGDKEL